MLLAHLHRLKQALRGRAFCLEKRPLVLCSAPTPWVQRWIKLLSEHIYRSTSSVYLFIWAHRFCRRGLRRKQGRDQPTDDQLGVRMGEGRDPRQRRGAGGNKHAFHGISSQVHFFSFCSVISVIFLSLHIYNIDVCLSSWFLTLEGVGSVLAYSGSEQGCPKGSFLVRRLFGLVPCPVARHPGSR